MAIGRIAGAHAPAWRRWHWRPLFLLLAALLLTMVAGLRWGYRMEEQLGLPMLFVWRGPEAPPAGALIVRVDDPSLGAFRRLPENPAAWPEPLAGCASELGGLDGLRDPLNETDLPRGLYACAIRTLAEAGAAAVQLDVVFPPNAGRAGGTEALKSALAASPHTALFGMADMARRQDDLSIRVDRNVPELETLAFGMGSWALGKGDAYNLTFWSRRTDFDMPLQLPVVAALVRLARDLQPALAARGIECPSAPVADVKAMGAGVARLLACLRADAHRLADLPEATLARIARIQRLAEDGASLFFNYYGPPSTLPSVSVAQLLGVAGAPVDPAMIADRVVFIGHQNLEFPTTLDDLNAVFEHPHGLGMSGVETAATAFLNVWHDDHIRPLPEPLRLAIGLLLLVVVATAGARGRPLTGMLLASLAAAGYVMLCLALFTHLHWWLPWLPVVAAWPFALVMAATGGYGRASTWVERLAGNVIAGELSSHDPEDPLDEHERVGTVLYCDLEGYSAMTRAHGMAAAARLIRRMFEGMEANILAEDGHIHQITGDGIIACWFSNSHMPDDADRACRAALAARRVMADVNKHLERETGRRMRMRIGLNAGPLLVTGMGRQTLHLAVVGETINTGQRIEQLVKREGRFQDDVAVLLEQSVIDRLTPDHGFVLHPVGGFTLAKADRIARISQLLG